MRFLTGLLKGDKNSAGEATTGSGNEKIPESQDNSSSSSYSVHSEKYMAGSGHQQLQHHPHDDINDQFYEYPDPRAYNPFKDSSSSTSNPSVQSSTRGYPHNDRTTVTTNYFGSIAADNHPSSTMTTPMLGTASEFDRYPHAISTTAASDKRSSVANSASFANGSQRSGSLVLDSDSEKNPFVVDSDFSPFGGYPASSFPLHMEEKEADDYIHNPDPILDAKYDRRCVPPGQLGRRGVGAVGALGCLIVGAVLIFIVLPVLTYSGVTSQDSIHKTTPDKVEVLTNYAYGKMAGIRTDLVDPDTPEDAKVHKSKNGDQWTLVFSDEFNKEGRTFYEGDDQFWTGPDFYYAATEDLEWYSPDAATTKNGALELRLDAFKNHNLFYRSGMLQSWNKLCFTQGYIEVSALLPGSGKVPGLWPGLWTLGNLARPGYGASSFGVWPYTYDSCDAGITPNQSSPDGLSFLPGQKLNKCTCKGHDHPNEGVGRGAPEMDLLEGTVAGDAKKNGVASQSIQLAPFDIWYYPNYDFVEIHNKSVTATNTWTGGPVQQAVSIATQLNPDWYEFDTDTPSYQSFGLEYLNDQETGYARWFVGDDPTFTLYPQALGANGNVGPRLISREPMSIVLNLGISNSWTYIDWPSLRWPSTMRIDYVRVYQPENNQSVTCDPEGYPTYDYIQDHLNAYSNPNLTTWEEAGYAFPPTQLLNNCD
uniref:ARAD1A15884p n=1 Tax=Blastobotrys adeninivorans TaxID=409370 RepID=A0A060SXX4_BLAAD